MNQVITDRKFCQQGEHSVPTEDMTWWYHSKGRRPICTACKIKLQSDLIAKKNRSKLKL